MLFLKGSGRGNRGVVKNYTGKETCDSQEEISSIGLQYLPALKERKFVLKGRWSEGRKKNIGLDSEECRHLHLKKARMLFPLWCGGISLSGGLTTAGVKGRLE